MAWLALWALCPAEGVLIDLIATFAFCELMCLCSYPAWVFALSHEEG